MNNQRTFGMLMLAALTSLSFAQTGNPLSDGWSSGGHSFKNGNYVRGAGQFSFDMYSTSFTVQSGDAFTASVGGNSWTAGDQVLALGAVFVASPTATANGWTSYSTGVFNDNITSSLRMVSKFGSDPTSFGASTISPHNGNGAGSFSGGAGGLGSVLIANTAADLSATPSGVLRQGSITEIYNGSGVDSVSTVVGRMMYVHNAGIVSSWEVFLNVTLLNSMYGGTYSDLANFGDRGLMTAQRGTNSTLFTDSMVATEAVPEPFTMVGLGLGFAALVRKRRKN